MAMAAATAWRTGSALQMTLRTALSSFQFTSTYIGSFARPRSPLAVVIPSAIALNIPSLPGLLEGIWESILRAVPKKKTTHSKSRSRRLAGKALKDVTTLCRCPACGEIKKMHYLCPTCATKLRKMMNEDNSAKPTI